MKKDYRKDRVIMKRILAVFLVIAIVLGGIYSFNFEQPQEESGHIINVRMSITGLEGESLTPSTLIETKSGENVLSVLLMTANADGIEVETSTLSGFGDYVTSIGGLKSGDHGEMSGWVYMVDGESPNIGMDAYKLAGGENIEIKYVT